MPDGTDDGKGKASEDAGEDPRSADPTAIDVTGENGVREITVPLPPPARPTLGATPAPGTEPAGEAGPVALPGTAPSVFWNGRWTAAAVLWGLAVAVAPWLGHLLLTAGTVGVLHWLLPQAVIAVLLVATVLTAPVTWRRRLWAGLAGPGVLVVAGALLFWAGAHEFNGTGFSAAWLDGFWLRVALLEAVLAGAAQAGWFVLRRLVPGTYAFVFVTMAFVFFLLRMSPQGVGAAVALSVCATLGAAVGQLITGRRRIPTAPAPTGLPHDPEPAGDEGDGDPEEPSEPGAR